MKTYTLLLLAFVLSVSTASTQEVHNLEAAKALAISQDKLIIIDFWATWCAPCKKMNRELWASEEFKALSDRFVLLKIDTDNNKAMAAEYGIAGIPRVMIITANEDKLYDNTGFSSAKPYLDVFNSFPTSYANLNQRLALIENKKRPSPQNALMVAREFQELAIPLELGMTKWAFINASDSYFKKAEKNSDSELVKQEAILYQILNEAYVGKHKKVMKKMGKLEIAEDSEHLQDLKLFVMTYCYQCDGDLAKAEALKQEIKDEELRSKLN
jgi:thiol-disulfide isomerase/thioredoxin